MNTRDDEGRPLVNTPEEALEQLARDYEAHRILATLSLANAKKEHALRGLEHALTECKRAVASCKASGFDDDATAWRKVQEFVEALCYELRMWIELRDSKYHAAWEILIAAQSAALWAARWLPEFEPAQDLERHLEATEHVVFPKQKFFSPSMIIDESAVECSICHARGGQCDHIVGEVYAGDPAERILHRITGVREISLVDKPANKHARALIYDGMDLLTGEAASASSK